MGRFSAELLRRYGSEDRVHVCYCLQLVQTASRTARPGRVGHVGRPPRNGKVCRRVTAAPHLAPCLTRAAAVQRTLRHARDVYSFNPDAMRCVGVWCCGCCCMLQSPNGPLWIGIQCERATTTGRVTFRQPTANHAVNTTVFVEGVLVGETTWTQVTSRAVNAAYRGSVSINTGECTLSTHTHTRLMPLHVSLPLSLFPFLPLSRASSLPCPSLGSLGPPQASFLRGGPRAGALPAGAAVLKHGVAVFEPWNLRSQRLQVQHVLQRRVCQRPIPLRLLQRDVQRLPVQHRHDNHGDHDQDHDHQDHHDHGNYHHHHHHRHVRAVAASGL